METPHHPKFVRWALMLGIIVILNIFFTVLISLAYPEPQYDDYCSVQPIGEPPADAATCSAQGGTWTNIRGPKAVPVMEGVPVPTGYCDQYATCQKSYETALDQHRLFAFALMIGLGIIALVAGLMPIGSSIVSSGLSYGGVLSFIIGSASYWGTAGNWIRFAIAAAGLMALMYIGWRRFRD